MPEKFDFLWKLFIPECDELQDLIIPIELEIRFFCLTNSANLYLHLSYALMVLGLSESDTKSGFRTMAFH